MVPIGLFLEYIGVSRKSFLGFTDNIHFVKFLFSDFLLLFFAVGAILSLFGPNSAIFWRRGWVPKIFVEFPHSD